ncbi:MAG: hypothetical protein PHV34_05415 [Verrucomicrobiae bacterium]|nr:hypothetical protein [Verrucomicrobiae bacterium]
MKAKIDCRRKSCLWKWRVSKGIVMGAAALFFHGCHSSSSPQKNVQSERKGVEIDVSGGFEADDKAKEQAVRLVWKKFGNEAKFVQDSPREGKFCALLENGGMFVSLTPKEIAAGDLVAISYHARAEPFEGPGYRNGLAIYAFDGDEPGIDNDKTVKNASREIPFPICPEWRAVNEEYSVPAGVKSLKIQFHRYKHPGKTWIDGVKISVVKGGGKFGASTGAQLKTVASFSSIRRKHGYPCTMYKAADFVRAKENIRRHEWARKKYGEIKRNADFYLDKNREWLRAFIPDKTPLCSTKCPKCGNGPWYAYDLINNGAALRCKACATTWDWDSADTSEDWNIHGVIRSERLHFILDKLADLGVAYQMEGDRRYAEKAAVLVERLAEVFKGYRMNKVNVNVWLDRNDPYFGKIDGWKYMDTAAIKPCLLAYDLIHDSGVLSPQQREMIERDLVTYARDYLMDGYGEKGFLGTPSIQDQGKSYWCVAACGALLGDEKALNAILDLYRTMLNPASGIFNEDGTFFECTHAYESQLFGGIWSIPEVLRGNLDSDIYRDPQCALMERCLTWYLDCTFPDGTLPAINDAHVGAGDRPFALWSEIAYAKYHNPKALFHLQEFWGKGLTNGFSYALFYRDPDAAASKIKAEPYGVSSVHLTGMGLMILRQGDPKPAQTMAFLDYGSTLPRVHKHDDYLNFGLFSCGMEMVSEIGYNHNPAWAKRFQVSPLAHNSILEVAGRENNRGKSLIWCVTPGPKLAEAGEPPQDSRFIAVLPRKEGQPLIVDIFRASGEEGFHTWTMHGRSDQLTIAGVKNFEPVHAPDPLIDGKQGRAEGGIAAVWTFPGEKPRGLAVHMPGLKDSTVIQSLCPAEEDALQAVSFSGGVLKPGEKIPWRGHLQVVRPGRSSVFAAVYAPYEGTIPPPVKAAWQPLPGREDAVALSVACGAEEFLILHATSPEPVTFGALRLDGRAAVVSLRDGQLVSLCLAAGREVEYGGVKMRASGGNACRIREGGELKDAEIQPFPSAR